MALLNIKQVREILNCSTQTVNRYCKQGKLNPIKVGDLKMSRRLFDEDEVRRIIPIKTQDQKRKNIAYVRVSSNNQKDDFKNQRDFIEKWSVSSGLIIDEYLEDVGSGLNFKRKNFLKLMDMVERREVENIVITHKDRLCRFAFDYLEERCKVNGTNIVVINLQSTSPESELTEDLMSIIHDFSCRLYGLRKYKKKEDLIKDDKDT